MKKTRLKIEPEKNEQGVSIITHDYLVKLCESEDKYTTPRLNDSLCLQSRGFSKIENLDQYYNLKCLYFNNNIIKKIENFQNLKFLRCLYLQNNRIQNIEGIQHMKYLHTLNLAHNQIKKIENLDGLDQLQNINLSFNEIKNQNQIEDLIVVQKLSTIDLSNNLLDGDESIVDFFANFSDLRVIYLNNNSIIRKISSYRKQMIADNRPVNNDERKLCKKWKEGGIEEEAKERQKILQNKQESHKRYIQEIKDNRKKYENFYNEHRIKKLEDVRRDLRNQNNELLIQKQIIEEQLNLHEQDMENSNPNQEVNQKIKEDNKLILKSNVFKIKKINNGLECNNQEIELIEKKIQDIENDTEQKIQYYQQSLQTKEDIKDVDEILKEVENNDDIYWTQNMIDSFEKFLLNENFNFSKAINSFNNKFNLNIGEEEGRNTWTKITLKNQSNFEDLDQLNYKYENRT